MEDILEHDFEEPFRLQIKDIFQFHPSQTEELMNSDYVYNIRDVRKKIIEMMNCFVMKHNENSISVFKF